MAAVHRNARASPHEAHSHNRIAFLTVPLHMPIDATSFGDPGVLSEPDAARLRVLARLGLDRLTGPAYLDIAAGHRGHAEVQRHPGRFTVEGLDLEAHLNNGA